MADSTSTQVVATRVALSDRLPVHLSSGSTEDDLVALGITLGDPDTDPLFRAATLPPGWRRRPGEGPMFTYVVDEHGRRRLGIFYRASFDDRRAELTVYGVAAYVYDLLNFDDVPLVIDEWATASALAHAAQEVRDREAGFHHQATALTHIEHQEFAADCQRRVARCDEILDQIRQHTTTTTTGGGAR